MKLVVWTDQVYLAFYGRFHLQMFIKACLYGKEHFNSPSGGFFCSQQGCQPKLKSSDFSF
jgi:hypothetical protein